MIRSHQPVKPGLIDPALSCPACGLGAIMHHDGAAWTFNAPKPHYLCLNCLHLFHIPLPRKPDPLLWRKAP